MIICPFCPTADILGLGELNAAPLYMEEDLEIPNTPDYIRLPFPIFSPDSMPFSSHVTPHVTARPEVGMAARAGTTESGGYLRLDPTASLQAGKGAQVQQLFAGLIWQNPADIWG